MLPPEVELIVGDVRDGAAVAQGPAGGRPGRAPRGRGRRRPEHVRGRPLRLGQRSRHRRAVPAADRPAPVRRVVVASSMSIYGEGLYRDRRRRAASRTRCARPRRRRRAAGTRSTRRGSRCVPVPTPEIEAPDPRLGLRAHEVRAGAPDADAGPRLRHGGRGAAAVERLRAGPGALESLYRRAGDLRLAPAQRPAADDLRGRRAAARLRPCRRRRRRPSCWRSSIRRPPGRSSTSAAARTARSPRSRALLARAMGRPDIAPEITGKARAGDIRHCIADIAQAPSASSAIAPQQDFAEGPGRTRRLGGRSSRRVDRVAEARRELEARGLVA